MKNFSGLRECADGLGDMFIDGVKVCGGHLAQLLYCSMLECPVSYNYSRDERLRRQLVPIEGALSHVEGLVLYALVGCTEAKNIVELGTYAGHSTNYLAEAAKHNDGRVDTVDLVRYWGGVWRGQAITLRNRLVVRQHKMDAFDYLEKLDMNSVDFVFEDTSHTFKDTFANIAIATMRLRRGGILVIHDVAVTGVEGCEVERAVAESGLPFHSFKVFPGESGLAVWRKS